MVVATAKGPGEVRQVFQRRELGPQRAEARPRQAAQHHHVADAAALQLIQQAAELAEAHHPDLGASEAERIGNPVESRDERRFTAADEDARQLDRKITTTGQECQRTGGIAACRLRHRSARVTSRGTLSALSPPSLMKSRIS
jgi:hypothetical protein